MQEDECQSCNHQVQHANINGQDTSVPAQSFSSVQDDKSPQTFPFIGYGDEVEDVAPSQGHGTEQTRDHSDELAPGDGDMTQGNVPAITNASAERYAVEQIDQHGAQGYAHEPSNEPGQTVLVEEEVPKDFEHRSAPVRHYTSQRPPSSFSEADCAICCMCLVHCCEGITESDFDMCLQGCCEILVSCCEDMCQGCCEIFVSCCKDI